MGGPCGAALEKKWRGGGDGVWLTKKKGMRWGVGCHADGGSPLAETFSRGDGKIENVDQAAQIGSR